MTTPFSTFAFAATGTGAMALTTLPNRLNYTLNVLDFGADPTGVTDSTDAIQSCIDYAYNNVPTNTASPTFHGTTVFIPAGEYKIGKGNTTPLRLSVPFGYDSRSPPWLGSAALTILGAGKEATVLKGSYSTGSAPFNSGNAGFLLQSTFIEHGVIVPPRLVSSMTIWNTSTNTTSGALYYIGTNNVYVHDCHFKAMIGLFYHDIFGGDVRDCTAESPAGGSPAGSIGFWVGQGDIYNCRATDLDYGFCFAGTDNETGNTTNAAGNLAKNCNHGFVLGHSPAPNGGSAQGESSQGLSMFSNVADTCAVGVWLVNSNTAMICANVFTGAQNVGLQVPQSQTSFFAGNVFLGTYSTAAIILYDFVGGTPSGFTASTMACMNPPSWVYAVSPDGGTPNAGGMDFIQCTGLDGAGLPPSSWLKFAGLTGTGEGIERNIIDGQKSGGGSAAFADIVSGGSSGRYKVRDDGSNWRRIG